MSVNTSQACLTAEQLPKDYPDVIEGTRKLEGHCKLEVKEGARPVFHPQRIPVALKGKLKKELDCLKSLGIIEKVTEPIPWVSNFVTDQKPNGQIPVCIDLKDLNQVVRRNHYLTPTPTIDKILPELSGANVFSIVDAKNGFWHIELDDDNSCLTTFNSPFGQFCWGRLPFWLCIAPGEFQRR